MPVQIPFNRESQFRHGVLERISPLLRRIIAPNPGPFTFFGTNTYVVGAGKVAVVDPGPALPLHLNSLVTALAGETITHILVTHTHRDHSPAAKPLKEKTGALTCGFGPHGAGIGDLSVRVEEGGDLEFHPDLKLKDGDVVSGENWTIEAVYTPGHTSNHLCYALPQEAALLTGDHVMSWSTSVVVPPDGDMARYMDSLRKLQRRDDRILWPAHGGPVRDPAPFLAAFVAHREERENAIARCLREGIDRIPEIVSRIYADVDKKLHAAAAQSVHAHLIKMVAEGRAKTSGTPRLTSTYWLA